MGAVDLVIQVESPPSIASGMQRIGRPTSRRWGSVGITFPKFEPTWSHAAAHKAVLNGQIEDSLSEKPPTFWRNTLSRWWVSLTLPSTHSLT